MYNYINILHIYLITIDIFMTSITRLKVPVQVSMIQWMLQDPLLLLSVQVSNPKFQDFMADLMYE